MHIPEQVPMRLIVGACRSGTTALLQVFAQHPDVHCVYQPIQTGLRHKRAVFPQLCAGWDLPFAPAIMGEFQQSVFDTQRLHMAPAARQYSQAQGSHETLARSTTFAIATGQDNVTTTLEQQVIQEVLEPMYACVRHIEAAELFLPDVPSAMHRQLSVAEGQGEPSTGSLGFCRALK